MKDLKHYFSSSPKDSENLDESSVSNGSPRIAPQDQEINGKVCLNSEPTLELKKKHSKKRKKAATDNVLSRKDAISSNSSDEHNFEPAKKKKKYTNINNEEELDAINLNNGSKDNSVSVDCTVIGNRKQINRTKPEEVSGSKKRKKSKRYTKENNENEHSIKNTNKAASVIETNSPQVAVDTVKESAHYIKKIAKKIISAKDSTDHSIHDVTTPSCELSCDVIDETKSSSEVSEVSTTVKKRTKKKKNVKQKGEDILQNGKEAQGVNVSSQSVNIDSDLDSSQYCTPVNEGKNKILNYFNKVDKLPEILPKLNHVLKVEAIIHSPPTGKPKKGMVKEKRKVKIKRNLRNDLDLITSEEDSSFLESSISSIESGKSWKMRVQFSQNVDSEINNTSNVSTTTDIELKELSYITTANQESQMDTKIEESDVDAVDIQPPQKSRLSKGNESQMDTKIEESDVEIVDVQPPQKSRLSKGNGTLASYFTIKSSTPPVESSPLSQERLIARKQFLESGVPDNMKKIIKNKISESFLGTPAPFPKHSHVRQKDLMNIVWNLPKLRLPDNPSTDDSSLDASSGKWSIHVDRKGSNDADASKPFSFINNAKKDLNKIKKEAPGFPVSKWYSQLKTMRKNNEEEMWNEKFKPTLIEHFLENIKSIDKFKTWLENHKTSSKADLDDSSNDFATSDDETRKVQSMALLVGPNGCGKTSAVYTVANQLGYEVLELNASCNRAGKRLLVEFSEATQSHKLQVSSNFFGNVKTKKEENERTLLLLEDADLVFNDYDEGFLSAVNGLASSSKRPVVLVTNDMNCKHLNKIIPNCQLHLKFNLPDFKKLGCWLRLVALVEGLKLSEKTAILLAKSSGGDVRQSLLQLQLFSSPKIQLKQVLCRNSSELKRIWGRIGECDLKNMSELKEAHRLLKTLTCVDVISKTIAPHNITSQTGMRYWDQDLKDSTCLAESYSSPPDPVSIMTVDELTSVARSMYPSNGLSLSDKDVIDETKKALMTEGIEGGIGCWSLLSRTSVSMDYLPALRRIALSEQCRLATQTKRNNRYFNHLHSIGLNPSDQFLNLLTTSFATSIEEDSH